MKRKLILLAITILVAVPAFAQEPVPIERLREDFLSWKFGMFIHFNVATFHNRQGGNGYEDPLTFKPDKLDCNQWAETAVSAGMKYAVLTVKHSGGWCLWDSKLTKTHAMSAFTNYKNGKGDIAREFVDAFRKQGLKVGFYYCLPFGIGGPEGKESLNCLPPEAKGDHVSFIKKQLTELLTNYGQIDTLWFDQNTVTLSDENWQDIKKHAKSVQPNCIVIANNSHDFKDTDIHAYEYPLFKQKKNPKMMLPPADNKNPAEACDKFGRRWFWMPRLAAKWNVKSAQDVVGMVRLCNSRKTNYLLNVAPDTSGLIPAHSVKRLREVGELLAAEGTVPSGDAKTETGPKTYPPNSKSNPLVPAYTNVSYGEHARNKLDFWQAKSDKPTPVIMILHGGGWTAGSKANVSRSPRFPNLRAIVGQGISVVAIDYRLIGKHTEGVMPPVKATLEDAARAVQFVRSKAGEWNIDKERIGSYGPSAGGCSSLWLAYHDDMADPKSEDPVARESTRLWCAAGSGAQTTLDPKQLKKWFTNPGYGGHAFGDYAYGKEFDKFFADREKLLPWIAEYSPWGLVSAGDPPVYLSYGNEPPASGVGLDSIHGVTFGVGLKKRCTEMGVECHLVYPSAPDAKYKSPIDYLVATLKASQPPRKTSPSSKSTEK